MPEKLSNWEIGQRILKCRDLESRISVCDVCPLKGGNYARIELSGKEIVRVYSKSLPGPHEHTRLAEVFRQAWIEDRLNA